MKLESKIFKGPKIMNHVVWTKKGIDFNILVPLSLNRQRTQTLICNIIVCFWGSLFFSIFFVYGVLRNKDRIINCNNQHPRLQNKVWRVIPYTTYKLMIRGQRLPQQAKISATLFRSRGTKLNEIDQSR